MVPSKILKDSPNPDFAHTRKFTSDSLVSVQYFSKHKMKDLIESCLINK